MTGSSSGLGKAVTEHFAGRDGWNVAATMRDPARGGMFSGIRDIGVFELDVTKPETVRAAVDEAVVVFGTIDVLFNNVGYGGLMLFEETTDESFRALCGALHRARYAEFGTMRSRLMVRSQVPVRTRVM